MLLFGWCWICYIGSYQVGRAENEGICIFSLPKLCSLSSTRRIITCGRWIHEHGIITSVTHGVMPVEEYLKCVERGRAASAKLSDFLRKSLQSQLSSDSSKAAWFQICWKYSILSPVLSKISYPCFNSMRGILAAELNKYTPDTKYTVMFVLCVFQSSWILTKFFRNTCFYQNKRFSVFCL